MSDARPSRQPSPLDRLLNLFAEVKAGEAATVLLLFLNIFLILTAYYVLKVVREQLTLSEVEVFGIKGAEIKSYLSALMAVLLVVIVPAYGFLASKVDRLKLIRLTSFFVIGCLILFWLWGRAVGGGSAIGLSFFVWLGIINIFLIAQFWSYANDIYSETEGKRLFAIIAIGQSAGAILGPQIAKLGADYPFELPLVCAGIFAICIFLYGIVNARGSGGADKKAAAPVEPLKKDGGFQLVFSNKYLLLIAFMILVTNVVNTTGEYILSDAAKTLSEEKVPALDEDQGAKADKVGTASVRSEAAAKDVDLEASPALATYLDALGRDAARNGALKKLRGPIVGRFYGDFFSLVNLIGLLIQMFLVSRIFKFFGVRAALFALPVIAFSGYAAIGIIGGLLVLRVAKSAENATDYSLQNTIKQALFLPTSREAKYKAKAAIDTFFVRFGDAASAGIVALGIHVLHFNAKSFALVNAGLAVVWILLNVGIAREHKKLVPDDTKGA